jgi:pimeloyl-ACP methyl ester carboxylesterase/DNA-binding CsgD family transcriptional regulator
MDKPPVHYVKTSDGYDVAYTIAGNGSGPTMLLPPFIHSHVELNWQNDFVVARRTRFLRRLSEHHRVVTFDNRGQGLSSRGLTRGLRLEDFDLDTEAVVRQLGDTPFVFVACARSSHLAVRFIERHPERVSALVLISAQRSMRDVTEKGMAPPAGLFDLLPTENWEFFLQTQIMPGLAADEVHAATEMLKQTVDVADYRITWDTWRDSDITQLLPALRLPTLVLHARDFPFVKPEEATRLASLSPGARLTMVDGYEIFGAAEQSVGAIEGFLAEVLGNDERKVATRGYLTPRQLEVLHLVANGRTNREIADELVLSVRTVERHLEDAYGKLGARNRFEAIAMSRDFLTGGDAG